MAAKHGRAEIDWELVMKNAAQAATVRQLLDGESLKIAISKIGLDGWLALLTPEQRRELTSRMGNEKK